MAAGHFFSSIRSRILLLLGVTFVILLGAAGYFVHVDRERDLDEAMTSVQQTAERIADKQNDVMSSTRNLLTLLAETHSIREFSPTLVCQQTLAHVLERQVQLANIMIAAPNGDAICNATPTAHPIDIADRQYFQKALAGPGIVIDDAIVSRSTGKWSLPFAEAVRNKAGQVQAVVVIALDLQWVEREFSKTKLAEDARLGLIDHKGTVLVRYPDPEKLVGKNMADTAFFKKLSTLGGTGVSEESGFDNVPRIYGFAVFAKTTSGPIYLWVGISGQSVFADANREFALTAAGMLIVLSLLFGTIWIGSERLFLRPVNAMAVMARKLGQGDHLARTGLRHGSDELGRLALTLDKMATALTSKSDLLRLNRALRLMSNCNQVLIRAESEAQLLKDICRHIVEIGGYCMAWVGFAENDEGKTVRPVAQYGDDEGYLDNAQISWADTERGRGPTGTAIRTGIPQVNVNFATNPSAGPWRDEALKRGYQSSTAVQLRDRSRVFGALTIYSGECDPFNAEEMALVQELADDLAFGIVTMRTRIEKMCAEQVAVEQFKLADAFFSNSVTCLVILDRNFNFIRVNDAYARACRKDTGEFAGRNHFTMYPSDAQIIFEDVVRTKKPFSTFTRAFVFPDQPERGVTYWDWTLVPILDKAGEVEYLVYSLADVTDRKRAEMALAESEHQFRSIVEQSIAGFYVLQDGKIAYANPRFAEILGYKSLAGLIGREMLSIVAETERGRVAEHMRRLLSGELGDVNYTTVYVRNDGSQIEIGVHGAIAKHDNRPAIIGLMQDISEKRRAEEAARRYVAQLESALMRTVRIATSLGEMRDPYTAGHERRVAEIAVAIGTELGFDAQRLEGLRVGGYLHDVGKMSIPTDILSKPSKLSAAEFELIKGHSQSGYDVLKSVEFPWPVAEMAWQHHERIDGSGYPRGLKGDEIILEARVLAVADVVEAMSSHRPYRPGLGIDKALDEIERGRGSVYDPVVADACLKLFREKGFQVSPV